MSTDLNDYNDAWFPPPGYQIDSVYRSEDGTEWTISMKHDVPVRTIQLEMVFEETDNLTQYYLKEKTEDIGLTAYKEAMKTI
jgi:hypothetical protein